MWNDGQSGIRTGMQQNLTDHGGRGGLAVSTADGNRGLVILHDLS